MSAQTADSQPFLHTCADAAVAARAERQHGVVSLAQLRAAGLGDGAIAWRVRRGRLHRVHRGVYAVGHRRIDGRGQLWAAVLAVPGAALSHWSAAAAWDLGKPPRGRIDVTTRASSHSTRRIRVHRGSARTTTQPDGLPLTTVAQTLGDLAPATPQHRLERLLERAEHLRLLDTASLAEHFGRRGGRKLQAALGAVRAEGVRVTRSELEERFLALIAEAGLERPEVNVPVGAFLVDFLWREAKLVAETDGAATHLTPRAFEADRRRDEALAVAGYTVVRFTWRRVVDEPRAVAATLRALL